MAVTTFAKIQHRRGAKVDLPQQLHEGELGFCVDTRELFIGNSLIQGGNTQILTDSSNLMAVAQYKFVSDTSVTSVTGVSANQPTVRPLQAQLDDAWVNVKAYGAQGDGITDDTLAIQRCFDDLYTKTLTLQENVNQTRKTVWFPAGRYRITAPLKLRPFQCVWGENVSSTQIYLDVPAPTLMPTCVIQLQDSLGQTGVSMGTNGAQLPTQIQVHNMHVQSVRAVTGSLILLERCSFILFHNCKIEGSWDINQPVAPGVPQTGVHIKSLGPAVITQHIQFVSCEFQNVEWAYYCEDAVQHVQFSTCKFHTLHKGLVTDQVLPGAGPQWTRVNMSVFENLEDRAIQTLQSASGVQSVHNTFTQVGLDLLPGTAPILWGALTTQCVSMADTFDQAPGVQDLGTGNLIVNAQQRNI